MLTWVALRGDLVSYVAEPRLRFLGKNAGDSNFAQSKPRSLQAHKLSWTKWEEQRDDASPRERMRQQDDIVVSDLPHNLGKMILANRAIDAKVK